MFEPTRGNNYLNNCAGVRVRKAQSSSELGDTLPHAADSNSNAIWTQLNYFLFDAFAIIANRNYDVPFFFEQTHDSIPGSRMPEHVGEGLLNDSEDRRFHFRLQAPNIGRLDFKPNLNSTSFR